MQRSVQQESREIRLASSTFVHLEHAANIALGTLLAVTALIALGNAAAYLWDGLHDWNVETILLTTDRLLLVLMLVEILHTVRVSMRSGGLTGEPFLIVGLIASIRRVLMITLQSSHITGEGETLTEAKAALFRTAMIELGVLAGLILVMVVSIYILRRAGSPSSEDPPGQPISPPGPP